MTHLPKAVFATLIIAWVCAATSMPSLAAETETADRVVIRKSERKLYLYKDDRVLRSMDIALGLVPTGDKRSEGDFRTPEGDYKLTERNPASDFFLSIQISYPNAQDERAARLRGEDPGGQIMIHGQPNEPTHSDQYYHLTDWTEGCVALSNSDMVDVWLMTSANTPIRILP
ncbi:MAG: murein L,D-transpeptidase family protein [Gammaproteobacteria bacterium]